jgi:arsenate reductase-like glutaredoxin family protein
MIENQPREMTLIYHSEKSGDRKTRAYVETLKQYTVKTLDLKYQKLTETQLAKISDKMKLSAASDLIDKSYASSAQWEQLSQMKDDDLVIALVHQPVLIKTPILIIGSHAAQYDSADGLLKANSSSDGVGFNLTGNIEEKRGR